jgi:hypothetical protein
VTLNQARKLFDQLLEETIQTVANGGLTSCCTRPELAGAAFFEINVPLVDEFRNLDFLSFREFPSLQLLSC